MNKKPAASNSTPTPLPDDATHRFIQAWGEMGEVWGISRSTARVHALLLLSAQPLGLDGIADTLQISRGNASMCLKELRAWGVVHKTSLPGQRKDYFVCGDDVWSMFLSIARQRKQREFDPARAAIGDLLAELGGSAGGRSRRPGRRASGGGTQTIRNRLRELETLLNSLDMLATLLLSESGTASLAEKLVLTLAGGFGRRGGKR